MSKKTLLFTIVFAALSVTVVSGFGPLGQDLLKKGASGDCEGKKARKDCLKNVAVGAAAAIFAQMVIDQVAKRKKTAEQVADDLRKAGKPVPKKATLISYVVTSQPDPVAKRGGKITIASSINVAGGGKSQLQESLFLYDPNDTAKVVSKAKRKKVNTDSKAGEFTNTFTFKLPKGAPQGKYPIMTKLFLNGKEVKQFKKQLQVVIIEGKPNLAIATLSATQ